ncbi:Ail/OmpX [Enterobacterales bacterium CwR94]|nr:Ail/OmpX [Enterobacterales bacterium CwR94]
MKSSIKVATLFMLAGMSGMAAANDTKSTVSLGYAFSNYKGNLSGNSPGANIKYNWEDLNSKWGVIGSVTRTSSDLKINNSDLKGSISHLSVLAGPSYAVSDMVSLYGLVGISHDRIKFPSEIGGADSVNSFAYGAGVRVTPISNWSVDLSYENMRNNRSEKTSEPLKIGTWAIGVGYSF